MYGSTTLVSDLCTSRHMYVCVYASKHVQWCLRRLSQDETSCRSLHNLWCLLQKFVRVCHSVSDGAWWYTEVTNDSLSCSRQGGVVLY